MYSQKVLSGKDWLRLIKVQEEEFDYTCGAPLFPKDHALHAVLVLRPKLTCATPVEFTFYKPKPLGVATMCSQCGSHDGAVDMELLKAYHSVLPMCLHCKAEGKVEAQCMRPKKVKN